MTNVPNIQFTPQGLILPTEQEILNGVLADFNAAFGGNLNKNLETPQGQLASSIAAIIADKNNQIAWLVNNLDPDYSEGFMQDAIGKLYFIKRKGQINSTVQCTFYGLPGTTIPKGFIVKDENNNDWVLDQEISILSSGQVVGNLTAKGIYSATANSVNKIHQSILGLDRVDNHNPAITGTEKESGSEFAERYKKSVAKNSLGMPASVYSNVASLDGVVDCYVIDNPKSTETRIGITNKVLKPHSVYVAVLGGNDQEIAKTIWRYAGNGCDFTGDTTVNVEDDSYTVPRPVYEIKFMRPNLTPIYFQVKLRTDSVIGSAELVKSTIKNTFDKQNRRKIGSTLYAIEFVSDVVNALPKDHLLDIKIGKSKSVYADSIELGIDQYPTLTESNISVVFI
ncbi:baseplate J/gp47 family protein [Glaesserella parasuis]|nr:baseplate J/gp47 family protein [Glaesserella parasuis]